MRPTPRLIVAVLASFLAGGIVPQAGLVAHDHADGAAPHVHLGPLAPHRHPGQTEPHVHDQGGGLLRLPRHVHVQHPFQHVDRTPPPTLARVEQAVPLPAALPRASVARFEAPARSRGPPPSLA